VKFAWANTSASQLLEDVLKAGGPLRYEGGQLRRTRPLDAGDTPS
jgi:hypothetical protein